MRASYLLRFDDLCPTMNWAVWDRIEPLLIELGVRPVMAIVPDNRDPVLVAGPPHPNFWERAREWQRRGWTIGMHGYQHLPITPDRGIVGLNARSEFAGLPAREQEGKLRLALDIFEREGIHPRVWVAPNCSFDRETLRCLKRLGMRAVSDGMRFYPHVDRDGIAWVPHQVWRFRPMPFGVWTVGLHCNGWNDRHVEAFERDVRTYRDRMVDFDAVLETYGARRGQPFEAALERLYLLAVLAKRRARDARVLRVGPDTY